MRNTSSPRLWPYPGFVLAAFTLTTGSQFPAEVPVGEWRRPALADLGLSTGAPSLLPRGVYLCCLACVFQESNTSEEGQEKAEETKNLLEQLISGIIQVVYRLTRVKISNLYILDITLEATCGNNAKVRIPITADINVKLPVLGEIVNLALNLVLEFCVHVETDEKTSVSQVVVEECKNNQHSISLTVLGRSVGLVSKVVDFAVNLMNEVLSLVMDYEPPELAAESCYWWLLSGEPSQGKPMPACGRGPGSGPRAERP
ncbi:short palate, lung and nasal epithelium carcinoma-associated protein 2A-like [Moschus berezovskii]|uniref:short palate, lung and nasal epithelium carcinoma-associated protein 2A-like n=1 Tax=Moschus berezovskii TaxID=68408 RepID=UPI002443CB39|nr:short palate, lung and nasal epithelium carcinoma-associated protein 2A-like [Moschus berezovskii]